MIAWYVEHNELVYAAMLTGFTLTAVCLGYFWYEVINAETTPARVLVEVEPVVFNQAGVVDVDPWIGHTP